MPLRRVVVLVLAGLVLAAVAGTALVLATGPSRRITTAYAGHRTATSAALALCVDLSVRGTAAGTRSGSSPLVRWTGVHLQDPTVAVAGYALVAGRCDRRRPIRLGATLQQTWSDAAGAAETRRTAEGPAQGTLTQFNEGDPIRLADRSGLATVLDPGCVLTGRIQVSARTSGGSEGFGFPVRVRLADRSR